MIDESEVSEGGVQEEAEEDEEELERMILTGSSSMGLAHSSTGVEVDVVDDDNAIERAAMNMEGGDTSDIGSRGSTLPRTLPSFPTDYRFEWSAMEPTIRGAESVKGGKASMKMKTYVKRDEMLFDEIIETVKGHVSDLRKSHPYLLADFFPDADK